MEINIDKRYFWGELAITGLRKDDSDNELNMFITKYKKDYIKKLFGGAFTEATLPDDLLPLLIDEDCATSPIANYIYYYWQRSHASMQTNAGVKVANTQNTISVSPGAKMANAWNEMVLKNIEIHDFLFEEETEVYDYLNDIYPYICEDLITEINTINV